MSVKFEHLGGHLFSQKTILVYSEFVCTQKEFGSVSDSSVPDSVSVKILPIGLGQLGL